MKKLLSIFSVTLALSVSGQNLVWNPGFETYVPDSINNSTGNNDVSKAEHWVNAGPGTSDYYHSDYNSPWPRVPNNDHGVQVPHGGSGYAGIYAFEITTPVNVREYIRTQLMVPLIAGQQYQVSFYASLADHSDFKAGFGVNLSATPLNSFNGYLMLAPEHIHTPGAIADKVNWVLVSGLYTATGGEEWLTIGGFFDDQNSDTMTVGGIHPNAYYYIDDVSVMLAHAEGIESNEDVITFDLYPDPASSTITLHSTTDVQRQDILLFDARGRVVNCAWTETDEHTFRADVEHHAEGMYTVMIAPTGSSRRLIIAR